MDERLRQETDGLVKSWARHDEQMLRDYLVADVEDPRINIQSILSRHFLAEALFGDRFAALMEQELQFGVVLNWLLKLTKTSGGCADFPPLLHALERGADNAEGVMIPRYIAHCFSTLPAVAHELAIPNYVAEILAGPGQEHRMGVDDDSLSTFEKLWRRILENEAPRRLSVLEPACGSANDYRFLSAFGFARCVDYTGFDLCEMNIRNAKAMFPGIRFEVGNAFDIRAADQSFDVCLVQDLFEHLSIEALERAVSEICRVAREGICVGFFSMHEGGDHIVRPIEDYHWNTLGLERTIALFEQGGFAVQPVHIGTLLQAKFRCEETHNENAYTFFATATESRAQT